MPDYPKLSLIALVATMLVISLSACGGSDRAEEDINPVEPGRVLQEAPPTGTAGQAPASEPPLSAEATTAPPSQAASAVFTFTISGGIVGFCDALTVAASGDYTLDSCVHGQLSGTLASTDQALLDEWYENLAPFSLSFEDNPGHPDSLSTDLVFNGVGSAEADQGQQQVIFDWVNGLILRLRPQPTPMPTPSPVPVGPEGLCPDIQRPALVVANYENPTGLILIDPDSQAQCDVTLQQPPFGRMMSAQGYIYYPAFDPQAQTVTVWELSPAGESRPLDFTAIPMEQFGPFQFVVSRDRSKIAWSRTVVDVEANPETPPYYNDLWVAGLDGSGQVSLLDRVENQEGRYVEPVRFSADNSTLFYALQPDGLGGTFFSFGGRYDTLYRLSTAGGQAELMYACPQSGAICIGDIAPDDSLLAVAQPGQGTVEILDGQGNMVATVTPPATDYVGWPLFSPANSLAFISISLSPGSEEQPPMPNPGAISLVDPPYTGRPETIISDNSVAALWEWMDENRLVYGSMDEEGNLGTAIVTVDGQQATLSPYYAVMVLR